MNKVEISVVCWAGKSFLVCVHVMLGNWVNEEFLNIYKNIQETFDIKNICQEKFWKTKSFITITSIWMYWAEN